MKIQILPPTSRSMVARRQAPAFTLVELIVVITIITILLTVGALGLKNLAKGSGVSAGVPVAEALFAEARAIAIGKGTNARVLIHGQLGANDEFHRERYLKYMAIEYEQLDDTGNAYSPPRWTLASRGTTLPDGVFFMKDLSETNAPTLQTVTTTLPGNSETTCYYYQFNSEGLITSPEISGDSVPRFVIQVATLPPGQAVPIASSDAEKNMGGFVIWRGGRTSVFRHPNQIENN